MTDILGPANANAVTVRPARSIVRGSTATWFRDCSSPLSEDGTPIGADFLNDVLAQLRVAISSADILADGNDDMLWRAMQAIAVRYAPDTGAPDNLVASFSPPVRTLYDGLLLGVKLAATNTGAATIACNGLAPVPIRRRNGDALEAGDLIAGQYALLAYLGGAFQHITLSAAGGGGGGGSSGPGVTGQVVFAAGNAALPGTLKLNGALVSRESYPNLWTYAQGSGRLVSDADWLNASLRRWTSFSSGDGATTFRLPELRGEFLRMWDDGRGVDSGRILGRQQEEMIGPHNHSGSLFIASNPTAKLRLLDDLNFLAAGSEGTGYNVRVGSKDWIDPAAISVVIAANSGVENRVRNAALTPCIVY